MTEAENGGRDGVLRKLSEMGIAYEVEAHPAVYTIDEMKALGIDARGTVVKNLFLRDANGKRHFLAILSPDKQADLKAIRAQVGCSALSFASEERLGCLMKLTKGAVSPLGVLNDAEHAVEVVYDKDLAGQERLGVHPNDNTATLWLSFESLERVIRQSGNSFRPISV
jgi:Ala-tRNA(Pro) deacylase